MSRPQNLTARFLNDPSRSAVLGSSAPSYDVSRACDVNSAAWSIRNLGLILGLLLLIEESGGV